MLEVLHSQCGEPWAVGSEDLGRQIREACPEVLAALQDDQVVCGDIDAVEGEHLTIKDL
jgi:hypothetical protein